MNGSSLPARTLIHPVPDRAVCGAIGCVVAVAVAAQTLGITFCVAPGALFVNISTGFAPSRSSTLYPHGRSFLCIFAFGAAVPTASLAIPSLGLSLYIALHPATVGAGRHLHNTAAVATSTFLNTALHSFDDTATLWNLN
jgi:hypothetical protein